MRQSEWFEFRLFVWAVDDEIGLSSLKLKNFLSKILGERFLLRPMILHSTMADT